MSDWLNAFIHHFGALGVALGAGVEGETAVVLGGALARNGAFSPWLSALAAWAGSFIADQIFFHIGRSQRQAKFVQRVVARPLFARAVTMIEQYPIPFCLGFRFIYGFRVAGPVAIGISKLPTRLFVLLNGVSAIVWGAVFTAIGFRFGKTLARFGSWLLRPVHLLPIIGLAALTAIIWAIMRRRSESHALGRAEPDR